MFGENRTWENPRYTAEGLLSLIIAYPQRASYFIISTYIIIIMVSYCFERLFHLLLKILFRIPNNESYVWL